MDDYDADWDDAGFSGHGLPRSLRDALIDPCAIPRDERLRLLRELFGQTYQLQPEEECDGDETTTKGGNE